MFREEVEGELGMLGEVSVDTMNRFMLTAAENNLRVLSRKRTIGGEREQPCCCC